MKNPIVHRELTGLLRLRKSLAIEVGLCMLWTLLVVIRWPADGKIALSGTLAEQAFMVLSYGLLSVLLLISPILPSGSIVTEKQRGTLGMLLIAPTSAWSIYLGKLASMLGFMLVLLATSIPGVAACYTMGGISLWNDILPLYGVLLMVAFQMITLGLAVSSYAATVDSSLRITFGAVLVVAVVPLGPQLFLQGSAGNMATFASTLRQVSPIAAIMQLAGHGDAGSQAIITSDHDVSGYLLTAGILALTLAVVTVFRLNQSMLDRPRPALPVTDDRSTTAQWIRRVLFLIDPQRRKSGIRWWMNPIMIKEFRCRRFGRLHWLLRLIAICAVISLTLTYTATLGAIGWSAETIGSILVVLQGALLLLLTPSLASGLISSEVESGGWNLLRTTPVTARSIVFGKLLSVSWTLLLILCATLPGYAIMIFIKPALSEQVKQVMVCLLLTALFAMLLSAAVSSFCRRTVTATAVAYTLLMAIFAGTMLIWLGRGAPFGHKTVEAALTLNPMAAALSVMGTSGFTQYELIPVSWWVTGALSAVLFSVFCVRTWILTRPD